MEIKTYIKEGLTFIIVSNSKGFTTTLSNLGASIFSITKNDTYLTLTPMDVSTFKERFIYHGKTIGRVANRIENGEITINKKKYKLDINERSKTLHGGKEGFSNQLFDYEIINNIEECKVVFHYFSKDGEGGFPGDVDTRVTYTFLDNKNEINLLFEARSNKDTLLALTNHTYFTLGSDSINNLKLRINADKYVYPNPKDLIPLRELSVNGVMDFRNEKYINKDIDNPFLDDGLIKGYDHHYIFNNEDTKHPQATLENDKYRLDIYTDFSGMQIYTDNAFDNIKWFGTSNKKRRAIALEPQDSTLDRKVLVKNELYTRFIRYCFN